MAMVMRALLRSSTETIRLISGLTGRLELKRAGAENESSVLYIESNEGILLGVTGDYRDVAFKFEIFTIALKVVDPCCGMSLAASMICGEEPLLVFRSEWERPALQGEVQSRYEQVVRGRGRVEDIEAEAFNIGLSMVGIVIVGASGENAAAILVSDNISSGVKFVLDPILIDSELSGCNLIRSGEVGGWLDSLGNEWTNI